MLRTISLLVRTHHVLHVHFLGGDSSPSITSIALRVGVLIPAGCAVMAEKPFMKGTRIKIKGLQSKPELNGKKGTVCVAPPLILHLVLNRCFGFSIVETDCMHARRLSETTKTVE